jgi:hypothetical protein
MKKLLLALILVACSSARAEIWLETANESGGKILLLQQECSGSKGKMVIATGSNGKNVNGCWYYFADMIHVVYQDGSTYSYDISIFKVKERK